MKLYSSNVKILFLIFHFGSKLKEFVIKKSREISILLRFFTITRFKFLTIATLNSCIFTFERHVIGVYRLLGILLTLLAPSLASAIEGDASAIVNHGPNSNWSDISVIAYSVFDPNPSDISVVFLRKMFGSVSAVLLANQDQLLGHLLGIFNQAMWVIAGGIVSFLVVTTVLHTSKEGELMGQRTHVLSLYKAVVGMTLLIPKASGYSLIQIIVMWTVLQGVNLADNLWTTALSYLKQGGTVATSSPDRYKSAVQVVQAVLKSETCMYLMQFYDQSTQQYSQRNFKPCPSDSDPINYFRCRQNLALASQPSGYSPDYSLDGFQVSFGTRPLGSAPSIDTTGMCGIYSWKDAPVGEQTKIATGMRGLVTELLPIAYQIAQNAWTSAAMPAQPQSGPLPPLPDACLSLSTSNTVPSSCELVPQLQAAAMHYFDTVQFPSANKGNEDRLMLASKYGWAIAGIFYRDLIKNVGGSSSQGLDNDKVILNSAKPGLPTLVNVQPPKDPQTTELDLSINPKITGNNGYFVKNKTPYILPMQLAFQAIEGESPVASNYIKKTVEAFDQLMTTWTAANSFNSLNTTLEEQYGFLVGSASYHALPHVEGSVEVYTVSTKFKDSFPGMDYLVGQDVDHMVQSLWTAWKHLTDPSASFQVRDLIGATSAFGVELMQAVLTFWPEVIGDVWSEVTGIAVGFTIAGGLISAISGWIQELGLEMRNLYTKAYLLNPVLGVIVFGILYTPSVALQTLGFVGYYFAATMPLFFKITITCIFWYLPLFLYVGLPIFMTGVLLGVYAPMVPYLLFTFGVFGWFIAVIEAMVAGPLIALGICHPAGQHDYLGRAEQAIMLLVNLLLRPAAMIIGLLGGTGLSFITLGLLNIGFSDVFKTAYHAIVISGTNLGNLGLFTVIMAFIAVYTTVLLMVINRCFALIYIIPDRLTRWLGGQPEQSMTDSVLEHIKGGMTRSVQAVAGSQSQTGMEMTKSVSASPMSFSGGLGPDKKKK